MSNPYAPPGQGSTHDSRRIPWHLQMVPTLGWIFDRKAEQTAPRRLKIAIALQAFIFFGMNLNGRLLSHPLGVLIELGIWGVS